jgi:hypothetical protein
MARDLYSQMFDEVSRKGKSVPIDVAAQIIIGMALLSIAESIDRLSDTIKDVKS